MTPTEISIADLTIAGFLDSATGSSAKRNKGDYAAIATVGADRSGHFYALDLWVRRAAPTAQLAAVFDLHERWNYNLFGIEINCFQQLLLLPLEEERKRRRAAGRPWQLPVSEVHHSQNKEMRIATLEPLVTNGWLRFAASLPDLFWSQLEAFPRAEHDDAIDALEAAIALLKGMQAIASKGTKRKTLRTIANY